MKGVCAVTAVYWLIAIIVLLVIEAVTMGLTTIWFAGGALAAFIACVAGAAALFLIRRRKKRED